MAAQRRLGGVRRDSAPASLTLHENARQAGDGEVILRHLAGFLDAFMWQADPETLEITFVSDGVREILGRPPSDWRGGPERWITNVTREDRARVLRCMQETAADGRDRDVEFRVVGTARTLRSSVRLISPPSGLGELWGITTDVTGEKRTVEALRETQERYRALSAEAAEFKRRSLEDPLTHLPNRVLFQDRLGSALRSSARSGSPFAVLLIDLDRFKELNDTLGHQAGDRALQDVALRLNICLRAADTPARIGGDEFAALLPDTDEAGAVYVAQRVVDAIQESRPAADGSSTLGASVGIAIYPRHGREAEEILAAADVAMYRAKSTGGGCAVADASAVAPQPKIRRRSKHHIARRVAIGIAATLAILAGAMNPAGQTRQQELNAAARLHAAAIDLEHASDSDVGDVVAGVEQTLAHISWGDVAKRDVATALERLERSLHGIRSGAVGALGERVESLIASIKQAEAVADVTEDLKQVPKGRATAKPAPPKAVPNVRPTPSATASISTEPSLP